MQCGFSWKLIVQIEWNDASITQKSESGSYVIDNSSCFVFDMDDTTDASSVIS